MTPSTHDGQSLRSYLAAKPLLLLSGLNVSQFCTRQLTTPFWWLNQPPATYRLFTGPHQSRCSKNHGGTGQVHKTIDIANYDFTTFTHLPTTLLMAKSCVIRDVYFSPLEIVYGYKPEIQELSMRLKLVETATIPMDDKITPN